MTANNFFKVNLVRGTNQLNLFRSFDDLVIYICNTHHVGNVDIEELQQYPPDYIKANVVACMSNVGTIIDCRTTRIPEINEYS